MDLVLQTPYAIVKAQTDSVCGISCHISSKNVISYSSVAHSQRQLMKPQKKGLLHRNPPRHPELGDLLRLIHQPHIQQQLRGTPDRTLESAENPRVRVTRVLAHCTRQKH